MEDVLREAVELAVSLGAEYAEARLQEVEAYGFALRNGVQEPPTFRGDRGVYVRVSVDGCLGFASTNSLGRGSIVKLAEEAVKAGSAARKLGYRTRFSQESAVKARWSTPVQKAFENVPLEEKMELLKVIDGGLADINGEARLPARFLSYQELRELSKFINSEGSEVEATVERVGFSAILTAYKPGVGSAQRLIQKGGSGGWEVVEKWSLEEAVKREGEVLARTLKEGKRPPRRRVDVVLGPEVVGIICHESCGHPQEADRIMGREAAQAGKSYLRPDMLGYRVGSEHVTIVDDPTLPSSYGYYMFDDEGVKAGERVLIEKGVVKSFLHNRETAGEFGVKSNGSARSSGYDKEPIVRMANTYMKPGDHRFEELIEEIHLGLFVKSFMEWNIDDRRFHQRYVGLEAYLIEKGELKGLVRNPVLELTTPGLYGSVDAASRRVEFEAALCGKGDPMQAVPVWHGGPEIRLKNIRLGER